MIVLSADNTKDKVCGIIGNQTWCWILKERYKSRSASKRRISEAVISNYQPEILE